LSQTLAPGCSRWRSCAASRGRWTAPERASRRAVAAHREVQRERTAFEEAPIGGALVSSDGHFTRVDRAFYAMVGYPAEELIGMRLSILTHPADAPVRSGRSRRLGASA
jgi:PAS domain-containing protein